MTYKTNLIGYTMSFFSDKTVNNVIPFEYDIVDTRYICEKVGKNFRS